MSTDFEHIVLTRFNTQVSYAQDSPRLSDPWLKSRLIPFEKYCLPSMQAQSTKVFTWVVLVDADSPDWFKSRLESYAPLVKVVYISGTLRTEDLSPILRAAGLLKKSWVLTTRLDSDDALATGHLKLAQNTFAKQTRTFIEFPLGYQLADGSLSLTVWRSSGFLTLIEKVSEQGTIDTAMCRPHNTVLHNEHVHTIWGKPQWMQSIHATNNESGLKVGVPRLRNTPPSNLYIAGRASMRRVDRIMRAHKTAQRRVAKMLRSVSRRKG